jgi:hypothetical protein
MYARCGAGLIALMVGQLFFVFLQLAIELVNQHVDRGVHVILFHLGKEVGAVDVYGGLGYLPVFFHRQDYMYVGYMIEVALQPLEFFMHE